MGPADVNSIITENLLFKRLAVNFPCRDENRALKQLQPKFERREIR